MLDLLKLLCIFAGVVLLLSRKWNLGIVLLLACAAIGLLFSYPLNKVVLDAYSATTDALTLRLALIVILIMVMSEILRQTGDLRSTVESLQALIPNGRIVIAALPALVGLLPMVGGAMFSAPMVDEVGNRLGVDSGRKTFVNYWFRHVWEPFFPLYPSALLAMELLNITASELARATLPLTAASMAGGLLFCLIGLPKHGQTELPPASRLDSLRTLASSIWPIALVIIPPLALPIDEKVNLILSLVFTITLMMIVKRIPLINLGSILRRHIPWKTVTLIFSALIFREVLETSGAVEGVSQALTDLNIPLLIVVFAVSFIPGLLTGLVAAAYSIGFPIALPLVLVDGGTIAPGWIAWMLTGGYMGVMCSPMHMCLALTRVYFKAEWKSIYRFILPSAALVVGMGIVLTLLS
jgi:integral membrane protein (TIGR00529 family)